MSRLRPIPSAFLGPRPVGGAEISAAFLGLRTPGIFLALFSIAACGRVAPSSGEVAPKATPAEAAPAVARDHERLIQRIRDVKARLDRELTPPADGQRTRCPDEVIAPATPADRTLILRTRDARAEARTLLPLRVVTELSSDEFSTIVAHLTGGAAALWDPASAAPRTPEDGRVALDALDALSQRPYLAELRIETYSEPALFRRKDAPRSEWNPGLIAGRLVIYDLSERRALCQAPVLVRGDAQGLPIRRRLREQTRSKLREALNVRAYAALESALASITSRFALPSRSLPGPGAERWAAAPEHLTSATRRFERAR